MLNKIKKKKLHTYIQPKLEVELHFALSKYYTQTPKAD